MVSTQIETNMTETCNTCVENFNLSKRKKIECQGCDYVQCLECIKHILLETKTLSFSCVNCKREWDSSFIRNIIPFTFINTKLKQHMKTLLFEKEEALMPATQPFVEAEIKIRELTEKIKTFRKRKSNLRYRQYDINRKIQLSEAASLDAKIILIKLRSNIEKDLSYYQAEIAAASDIITLIKNSSFDIVKTHYKSVCPSSDCRGYLNDNFICGLCNTQACDKCFQIKNELHVCKQEDVESVKLIQKESKPCPRCKCLIMKVVGTCDQVFCTMCHIPFSWKTGKIDSGNIHNPEYFQIIRSKNGGVPPRNLNDIPCGGLPNMTEIGVHLDIIFSRYLNSRNDVRFMSLSEMDQSDKLYFTFSNIFKLHEHIRTSIIPKYTTHTEDNRDIRIKYMLKELSKDKFEKIVMKRYLDIEKRNEVAIILSSYQNSTVDIIQYLMTQHTKENIIAEFNKLDSLRLYINECFSSLEEKYKCTMPLISHDYMYISSF